MDNKAEYGNTEFDDYLTIMRRQLWHFTIPFLLIAAAAIALSYLLPPVYQSQATILVKKEEVPTDLIETTVTGYVQERIDLITQSVLTTKNLALIAKDNSLYSKEILQLSPSDIAMVMREAIGIYVVELDSDRRKRKSASASVRLTVSFESYSPEMARMGAQAITDLILKENRIMRVSQAEGVVMFLEKESEKILSELVSLEENLAQLKQDQNSQMPEQIDLNRQRLAQLEFELERTSDEILEIQNERMKVQSQLSMTDRYSEENDTPEQRLIQAKNDYAEARQKYSFRHPDVIRLKNIVAHLNKEAFDYRNQDSSLLQKRVEIANPEYLRMVTLLDTIDRKIAAQNEKKLRLVGKIADYEKSIMLTPQIEIVYASIMREYENVNREFLSIKEKQLQARLAMELEKDQKAGSLTLLESPVVPGVAIKPNRIGIALLGLMFACAVGLTYAFITEVFDRTIRGSKSLSDVTGAPPISVIPYFDVDEKGLKVIDHELKKAS